MSNVADCTHLELTPIDNRRLADLCGQYNEYLRQIEQHLSVEINHRGHHFNILGQQNASRKAVDVLNKLYNETHKDNAITPAKVHLFLQEANDIEPVHSTESGDNPVIYTKQGAIKPRNRRQHDYLKNITHHDINFGIGPAGTGKTYLAVACAISALQEESVSRILLVRPAVEAGERLGFLPGDYSQKIDPYLRPLYDALYDMLGAELVNKHMERNTIELAPLAYMRGRTLNDAFIILDEAQNTTQEQMKMFLTRVGFGSKAVITGDITQIDLPKSQQSGLRHAMKVLSTLPTISFTHFQAKDVVRHPIVQRIVEAYDAYENDEKKP